MKILILASNPRKDLNLDREIRDLRGVIENSRNQQEFEVVDALAVRVGELQELLHKHQPQIVHFCGHGGGEQGLSFESDSGQEHLVHTEALSDLFRLFSRRIECVLLNACYSEEQAGAIVDHINYVIGMNQEIRDDAAIAFSKGFYRALGYACSIEQSYEFGCNAIQLEISGSSVVRSTASETERKLGVADAVTKIVIPEHQKPIIKKKQTLTPSSSAAIPSPNQIVSEEKRVEIQLDIDTSLKADFKVKQYRDRVREFLGDHKLTEFEKIRLEQLQKSLGLSAEEVGQILREEQALLQKARDEYEEMVIRLIEQGQYPFSVQTEQDLGKLRQEFQLTDEEVNEISRPILEKADAKYQAELAKQEYNCKIVESQPMESDSNLINEVSSELPRINTDEEEIPDFLNNLLEDYFNKSSLKWSLCFTGEDESSKLGELIAELRNGFSDIGNGKQVPSGFSYWGIVSTLAWKNTSSDPLYPVMSDGTSFFNRRLNEIFDEEFTKQKYHYVSLGVGTGDKDNEILKRLYSSNNSLRYFPVDMSSTMLRLGVQNATKGIPLKGSHVLPIQIDFSIKSNVIELRQLLDKVDNDDPILFSLLGNTLANFPDDTELLKTVSNLMRSGDKLLLGVATTEELNEEAAAAAAKEYATASSFKKFVTSALLQYTDLRVDFANICFEGSIEQSNKSLLIKILYRNLAEQTIPITLPDWESVDFKQGDTIRLLTTRKYSSEGLNRIILNSKLRKINSSMFLLGGRNQYGFGLDLILLMKEPG